MNVGQVETTIIVAQIPESRNGFSTQRLVAVNPPMATTPSVMRVMSQRGASLGSSIDMLQ